MMTISSFFSFLFFVSFFFVTFFVVVAEGGGWATGD
jgi:hypothetical protein